MKLQCKKHPNDSYTIGWNYLGGMDYTCDVCGEIVHEVNKSKHRKVRLMNDEFSIDIMHVEISRIRKWEVSFSTRRYIVKRNSFAWKHLPEILDKSAFKTYIKGKLIYSL